VTAWQDPVFGPLLTGSDGRGARTLLIPFGGQESSALAADLGLEPDALSRLSALLDGCPELAALRVEFRGGPAVGVSGALAPASTENPYLRRLRRAPVE
jgi:hypothetical protein